MESITILQVCPFLTSVTILETVSYYIVPAKMENGTAQKRIVRVFAAFMEVAIFQVLMECGILFVDCASIHL